MRKRRKSKFFFTRRAKPSTAERDHYQQYKELARADITKRVEYWNRHYNFIYNRIAIKNHQLRWGSCSSLRNLNFNYIEGGYHYPYQVVHNEYGCVDTAFRVIYVEPYTTLYVPNAFTPNGDGENDILYVRSSIVEELIFRVYNRWGELVFETADRTQGWDGTFKEKLSDPDVYDYYLKGFCLDEQEFIIQGNITLIR
jgi:gliding motility-associated-like protein